MIKTKEGLFKNLSWTLVHPYIYTYVQKLHKNLGVKVFQKKDSKEPNRYVNTYEYVKNNY